MKRILCLWIVMFGVFTTGAKSLGGTTTERPNVLWITCEDISPNLGCYGDKYSATPNLDALARQSVRYTQAFATAPACSPSRSCLITGMYATSLNSQHLRSRFPIPAQVKLFPTYLRRAGYYCSNNTKTDYNIANERAWIAEGWDASNGKAHWRNRAKGQPFFSVFNFTETHQSRTSITGPATEKMLSSELPTKMRHDPAKAPLPPYYPDTPLVRQTVAQYYDCIIVMDKRVGHVLRELEEDGLAEQTIVFFFSDHGMGMPRGKRTLYDSGMRVPLLVRFPEKFKHLAPAAPGQTENRLVSFVDFAPSVLSLLELEIPAYMQGVPFLGKKAGKPREVVFGARDRVDEAFDVARSVRGERYLYIRNYLPHLSWKQPEGSSDRSAMRREITRLAEDGRLNEAQLTYAGPARPIEELYDTTADPHQVHNLAQSKQHAAVLARMRNQMRSWILESRDLGFLPEEEVWSRLHRDTPLEMARDPKRYPLKDILDAADLVGQTNAVRKIRAALQDKDSGTRYWAAVALRASANGNKDVLEELAALLKDPAPSVRIEAAAALAEKGERGTALPVLMRELQGAEPPVVLHAARTLQLLGEGRESIRQAMERCSDPEYRLYLRFCLEGSEEAP